MKKYVKPIMESEEFIANEYISNCYAITDNCNHLENPNYEMIKGVNSALEAVSQFGENHNGYGTSRNGDFIFIGTLNGSEGTKDEHSSSDFMMFLAWIAAALVGISIPTTGEHHDLTVTQTSVNDSYIEYGPNAS